MFKMFAGASSFNQPLDRWNISSVVDMQDMFKGSPAKRPKWYRE